MTPPHPDPCGPSARPDATAALLAEAPWVHRLARALLRDDDLAADVAQDTLTAALSQPLPSERPRLRAWLRTVAQRLAAATQRQRRERSARERRAARPEGGGDAGHVQRRLQLHHRLSAAVMTLPEPYRTAVTLRFFDGLAPRALAQRLGVSAETARQRVHRGVALLRERLDAAEGGRSAWRATLAAALPHPASYPLLWIPVMASKLYLGAAAVAVASLGTWLALRPPPPAPLPPASAATAATAGSAAPGHATEPPADAEPVPQTTPSSRRAVAAAAADDAWVVRGVVLANAKTPLADAPLRVRMFRGAQAAGEPVAEFERESDADGQFDCALPAPTGTVTLDVRCALPGYRAAATTRRVPKGAPAPQDLKLLCRRLDHVASGHVLDSHGAPIASAWVSVSGTRETVGADGAYSVAFAGTAGSQEMVNAGAPGYASVRQTVRVGDEGGVRADFTLLPGFRIPGRVTDEDGLPVAGATVCTFYTSGEPVTTDADGRFEITHAEPGRNQHSVFARKAGYVEARRDVEAANAPASCDLVLRRGAEVRGRVFGPTGTPLPQAELYIGFSPSDFSRLEATSDDDGLFAFPAVGFGKQTLVTSSAGLAPDTRVLEVLTGQRLLQVDVHLQAPHRLRGHVRDRDGRAVAKVTISVLVVKPEGAEHRDRRGEYIDVRASTDANGAFALEGLPSGVVNLEVYGDAIVRVLEYDVAVDRDDVVVVVEPAAQFAGTVVDAASAAPVPEFTVRFLAPELEPGERAVGGYSATWVREGQSFRAPDGTWRSGSDDFEAGVVTGIEVSAPSYAPARTHHVVAASPADPSQCVVRLVRGATVRGRVQRRQDGAPVAGARVTQFDRARPLREYDDEDFYGRITAVTGADGRFELANVPPGDASLRIDAPDLPRQIDGPFTLADGDAVERAVFLDAGAVVGGRLVGTEGAPFPSATVRLHGTFPGTPAEAECAADGTFQFRRRFAPGGYQVTAEAAVRGGAVYLVSQELRIEGSTAVELKLAPAGTAALVGHLVGRGVEVPARTVVTALRRPEPASGADERTGQLWSTTIAGDRFEIRGLPPGQYAVTLSAADNWRVSGNAECTLTEGSTAVEVPIAKRER